MQTQWIFMKHIRLLSAVVLFVAAICPALAADPIFPPGVRVGVTPLVGLVGARTFVGFETEDHGVKVLMAELPAEAYNEVVTAFKASPAGTNGIKPQSIETSAGIAYYTAENARDGTTNVRRYSMILPGGAFSGYIAVQVPENASRIYTDEAIRQMFSSAAVRRQVPLEEQLGLMPFKISELGDFKNVRTLAVGSAVLLADGEENSSVEVAPFMVLSLMGSAPAQPDDRGRFAQEAAISIPGVREARMTMSEPVRIGGMPGYETRIDGIRGTSTPVTVVQWLRFGGPTTLRIIGSAPRDQWAKAFPRFRTVRDGIQPR
jgi:hypothetical protein